MNTKLVLLQRIFQIDDISSKLVILLRLSTRFEIIEFTGSLFIIKIKRAETKDFKTKEINTVIGR